jgi:energy-coupling factor transport system substrate-specific component
MHPQSLTDPAAPIRPRKRVPFTLKDLVLLVVLGVVFGFLYWALVQAWTGLSVLMGPAGDLASHFLIGGWLLVAPIAIAIIRRPFAGIIAEMLAAGIEIIFLGSPAGPVLFIVAAIQGLGSELPFALTRYKSFSWRIYALSGLMGAGLVFFFSAFRFGWYGQDLFTIRLVIQLVSGIVLGGLLARMIVQAVVKTGVVDNFAIGRDRFTKV